MCNRSPARLRWNRTVRVASATMLLAMACTACGQKSSAVAPSPVPPAAETFALTGTVTNADDSAPLAGARVEIAEGAATDARSQTDTAGRYTIANLAAGPYTIRVTLDGFKAASSAVTLDSARTLDFLLTRTDDGAAPGPPEQRWRLSGTVIDAAARTPVAGARIEIVDRERTATTDAEGRYDLPELAPGQLTIRAAAEGFVAATSSLALGSDTTLDLALDRATPLPPAGPSISGRVLDVLSEQPLPDVTVSIVDGAEARTDGDGRFTVNGSVGETQRIRLTSPLSIERHTQMRTAGDAPTLTLMPRSLNLQAFDQMLRGRGELHRWVHAPRVVIQRRVLTFTNTTDAAYIATEDTMTEDDAAALAADLVWALPQLTGHTFTSFASVDVETAAAGESVVVTRPETIVVARFTGLESAIAAWGYGRWAWNGAGEVQMGIVMLDDAFDRSASPHQRSLRAHELGHALGYDHVADGVSVMHASGRIEPTTFDLDATTIAFRRMPLNQSPDVDPDPVTVNRRSRSAAIRWEGAK